MSPFSPSDPDATLCLDIERDAVETVNDAVTRAMDDVVARARERGVVLEADPEALPFSFRARLADGRMLTLELMVTTAASAHVVSDEPKPPAELLPADHFHDAAAAWVDRALRDGFDSLTSDELAMASVHLLIAEVNNGGFHQYFFNSASDHAQLAATTLERARARKLLALLRKAAAIYPGGVVPTERDERQAILERLDRKGLRRLSDLDFQFVHLDEDPAGLVWKTMRPAPKASRRRR